MLLTFHLHFQETVELEFSSISGLVVEYIIAIDVTRVPIPG